MTKISTPCINVCKIDPKLQRCSGCWRTTKHIEQWLSYTEAERFEIMEEIKIAQTAYGRNVL